MLKTQRRFLPLKEGVVVHFEKADLYHWQQLKEVYEKIIADMDKKGIKIWDEYYPVQNFKDDIAREELYILLDGIKIVSAVALCSSDEGEDSMQWENSSAKAVYLSRFGVNVDYLGKGYGQLMLELAKQQAKKLGYEYIRLFVVDKNTPAINLYLKCGYKKVEGIYRKTIDNGFPLEEYGFELKI